MRTALCGIIVLTLLTACSKPSEEREDTSAGGAAGEIAINLAPPSGEPAATPEGGGTAGIKFPTKVHDFGKITETESRSMSFAFTNNGTGTLEIGQVKTTCGCTAATLSRKRYAPGESGTIDVVFDPTAPNKVGEPQKKYINVFSNTPEGSTQLMITADVQAFIDIQPRMLRVGTLRLGEEHREVITITSPDASFALQSVRATNPEIRTELLPDLDDEGRHVVNVTVPSDAAWGPLFSWIEVTGRGSPKPGDPPINHTSRIRLQGQVFGQIAATPDTFRYGVQPGETFERRIKLYTLSGKPFQVLQATVNGLDMESRVDVVPLTENSCELVLIATAGTRPSSSQGTVLVRTNLDDEHTLEIPIVGRIRATPG